MKYKYLAFLALFSVYAQSGILYTTDYSSNLGSIYDTNTNTLVNNFTTTNSSQNGIAIHDTLKITNAFSNGTGAEYDLNGVLIQNNVFSQTDYSSLYDGTTDGSYNYAIDHNGHGFNKMFRFDSDWGNGIELFTLTSRGSGVSYDSSTNTLWTTEDGSAGALRTLRQYSLAGSLLSEFNTDVHSYGLAFDVTDSSLWVTGFGSNTFKQYSSAGAFLATSTFSGTSSSHAFGMEFDNSVDVPEPSTLAIFALGMIGLASRRFKKQS